MESGNADFHRFVVPFGYISNDRDHILPVPGLEHVSVSSEEPGGEFDMQRAYLNS